ncbi:MAG: hypothetical protein D3910_13890, partial [Candidatus Electrothrix sp. ATG2]|nr:hypothetical protein [Candidatus Electrothrix sp. ATG2]
MIDRTEGRSTQKVELLVIRHKKTFNYNIFKTHPVNRINFALRNIWDKACKALYTPGLTSFYYRSYIKKKDIDKPVAHVISYPKCGRTWLRLMLSVYYSTQSIDIISLNNLTSAGELPKLNISFSHHKGSWVPAPRLLNNMYVERKKFSGEKIVLLVRDPRDVLVSAWHHLVYRERIYTGDLNEFIHDPLVGIDKLIRFMNMWLEAQKYLKGLLVVKYEDLLADCTGTVSNLLEFLGEDQIDRTRLSRAVELCSFNRMKRLEKSGASRIPWFKPGNMKDERSFKVRSGRAGQ